MEAKKNDAVAKVLAAFLAASHLVGPSSYVKERLGGFKEAGVTVLRVNPIGKDSIG